MANFNDRIAALGITEAQFNELDAKFQAAGIGWGDIIKYIPCLIDLIKCLTTANNPAQCLADFLQCIAGKLPNSAANAVKA
jgi:hypothetical protein